MSRFTTALTTAAIAATGVTGAVTGAAAVSAGPAAADQSVKVRTVVSDNLLQNGTFRMGPRGWRKVSSQPARFAVRKVGRNHSHGARLRTWVRKTVPVGLTTSQNVVTANAGDVYRA